MTWATRPTAAPPETAFRLVRVPARGGITGIVTSDDLLGTDTHWWGGRTRPCLTTDCDACAAGQHPRWHGYLGILGTAHGEHAIIELTPTAIEPIEAWLADHSSLRGARLTCTRLGNKSNGRIITRFSTDIEAARLLPPPIDVQHALERIWQWTTGKTDQPPSRPHNERKSRHTKSISSNGTAT